MDFAAIQAWFNALPRSEKVVVLLNIMFELTLVMRELGLQHSEDCETRWRLAYHLSEMNHRFTSAAWAMMENRPTIPGDVLMEILLDQTSYPELGHSCQFALGRVMERYGVKPPA